MLSKSFSLKPTQPTRPYQNAMDARELGGTVFLEPRQPCQNRGVWGFRDMTDATTRRAPGRECGGPRALWAKGLRVYRVRAVFASARRGADDARHAAPR